MFEKNRKEKWFFLTLLFLLAVIAFICFVGLNAQAKDTNKKFINIQNITTNSGINIWLVEDHSLPIVSLKFLFKDSGTSLDTESQQGLVRLLSNTMDEGAGDMDSNDFQKTLADNSISLLFNASRDDFGGSLTTLTRNKDKAFHLLSIAIQSPRFDSEPLERMRDANISRLKSSMSEPDWIAARIINDVAFSGHPYAQNSGGTMLGLKSITADNLKNFWKIHLTKDQLIVAASGDITPEDLKLAVDAIFSKLPDSTTKSTISESNISNLGKTFLYKKDIPQTFIEAMIPAFDNKDPDYYALQVLNYIYGGAGFGSRLMETAREKRGLTYGIYSSLIDFNHADAMSISTSTKNESAGEILDIIKNEMEQLQNHPFSKKELDDAKSYITGSMPLSLKSTDDLSDIAISVKYKNRPIDYLDHYAQKINAVTIEDIQRVAKRILKPENMVTVLVGMPENIKNAQIIESLPNVE